MISLAFSGPTEVTRDSQHRATQTCWLAPTAQTDTTASKPPQMHGGCTLTDRHCHLQIPITQPHRWEVEVPTANMTLTEQNTHSLSTVQCLTTCSCGPSAGCAAYICCMQNEMASLGTLLYTHTTQGARNRVDCLGHMHATTHINNNASSITTAPLQQIKGAGCWQSCCLPARGGVASRRHHRHRHHWH